MSTIEAEVVPEQNTMAVQKVESGALGRALTVDELHRNLEFIREVMRKEMREGQDYGKIPGTGEKPTLLQPGAQKLLMTFNLTEKVKKETLREYPGFHREYEFTVTVEAQNGKVWDGVGTCSTLESKYRYRKAERRCPTCGKEAIIQGKAEYGGGWVCFKKKGGCGAKFPESEPKITSQAGGSVENEDPADCWNTVRKMAFKRALVAAAINATNTSELWTQDLEEMAENAKNGPSSSTGSRQAAPGRAQTSRPPSHSGPATQSARSAATAPATATKPGPAPTEKPRVATAQTRAWMIRNLTDCIDLATEYFRKLENPCVLMPNETLEQLPLEYVPISNEQMRWLQAAITDFGNGDEPRHAFRNTLPEQPKTQAKSGTGESARSPSPASQTQVAGHAAAPPVSESPKKAPKDDEAWRDAVVPIPPKGMKLGDYSVNPDTIGSLYDQCKSGTEAACKRLWGFANHFEPKPWTGRDGKTYPASERDVKFRADLDAFFAWHEKHGDDTQAEEPSSEPLAGAEDEETSFDRL
jgi:hypothetical protein